MIKIGIIGMGIRGSMFAATAAQNGHCEVTAVCDSDEERARASAGNAEVFGDYRDMIASAELDAVVVATPDPYHKEPFLAAVRKGYHVLVEKPFALSYAEAREMADAAEERNVTVLVGFANRWNPPFAALKEHIAAGGIGRVSSVNFTLNDTIHVPTGMIRWAAASSPGWFLLPHAVDLVSWLTESTPTGVFAWGKRDLLAGRGIDTYDSMKALIRFDTDFAASFNTSWILPESLPLVFDMKVEIIGTEGAYYVDLQNQMVKHYGETYANLQTLGHSVGGRMLGAPSLMFHDFIDHIRLGTRPDADHRAGLINTRVIELIHRSAEEGTFLAV